MQNHILYRWDYQDLGIDDPTRNDRAAAIQSEIKEMFPSNRISVSPVKINIRSSRNSQVDNETYLSYTRGVGGHIVGFLTYEKGQETHPALLNYTTFSSSQYAFRDKRHLFIVGDSGISPIKDRIFRVTDSSLEKTIATCDGILKYDQLGMLMPQPNGAEVNFVGNGVPMNGFRITFGDEVERPLPGEEEEEEEEEEYEDEAEKYKKPFRGFIGRGKEEKKEGVPGYFYKILDSIWDSDKITVSNEELTKIRSDECPGGGRRRSRTRRSKTKKSKKRRLNTKKVM